MTDPSNVSRVVRLPAKPGCVPMLGYPFLLAGLVGSGVVVFDAVRKSGLPGPEVFVALLFVIVGVWGVFARHAIEVNLETGVVRSGTGLFRARMSHARELGMPLKLELKNFELRGKDGIEVAYAVMLVGPRGSAKLDDAASHPVAREKLATLAGLLGLSDGANSK